ncbi:MAG: hypothetical protein ACE5H1_05100 [Thermodesulfobacteriota bacterium]
MKYFAILSLFFPVFVNSACDLDDVIPETGLPDPKITVENAEAQLYNLSSPLYEMQVSIRNDVDGNEENILDKLDEMAADFLDCQFDLGAEIGFQDFLIQNGDTITPLSGLRVFVVPFTFKCDAVDRDECAGIYFFGSDIIVISKRSIGQCDDLSFWKHEVGHRYG